MRILVCVKRVPAPGARILITPDGRSIDAAHLAFTVSPHEECAVEEAVRTVEEHGGETTVLTVGPPEAEEQLRYAASTGIGRAILVETDGDDWDPQRTAAAITGAVGTVEERDGTFDLVLFGNESADTGGYQVGIRVAHALGRPMVNGAKDLRIEDDAAVVRREAGGGFEVYRLPLPAVVGVKEGINLPRYPTLKGRLASRKLEIERPQISPPAGGQSMVRLVQPVEETTETEILGHGPEAAPRVADLLAELGVM